MKEWMDLYDCQGRVKGLTHTTTQTPQDGNFYLATRIWVRDAALTRTVGHLDSGLSPVIS